MLMPLRYLASCGLLTACVSSAGLPVPTPPNASDSDSETVGVLVMAHGGSDEWNGVVETAVAPLARELPAVLALGMADPSTLVPALDSLRTMGVTRVAVVRLFVSGRSFLDRTRHLLGISPERPGASGRLGGGGHGGDTGTPIDHGLAIATHEDGLVDSPEVRRILTERVERLSSVPGAESVLLLAHGMENEQENDQLLRTMGEIGTEIQSLGFRSVFSATLREDWAEKRAEAEMLIRDFVRQEAAAGTRVIVVPVRLTGFGPYAGVLAGLDYDAAEGLLPHAEMSGWLRRTASRVICDAGWDAPMSGRCDVSEGPAPTGR